MSKKLLRIVVLSLSLTFSFSAFSQSGNSTRMAAPPPGAPVLAALADLQYLKIPIYAQDLVSQVGLAFVSERQKMLIHEYAHTQGKCGGFEALPYHATVEEYLQHLRILQRVTKRDTQMARLPWRRVVEQKDPAVVEALSQVSEENLRAGVQWLSSFKTRNEKAPTANDHVVQMKARFEQMRRSSRVPVAVELIDHKNTRQKSLRITIPGRTRPNEIVVLGGHHDSLNMSWSGGHTAPGADDNASGSSNLMEIARILLTQAQPERTVQIMWYAAEESGLVGSAEIAKGYRAQKADVVGVLQLDMTSYPGSGEMTIANLTDFTSPWMQNFIKELNGHYVGLNIIDDKCGYGCSDHASWYRQGYATVVPFESKTSMMNPNIHTARDLISPKISFKHSAAITKLSLAWAMELANSDQRAPVTQR